MLNMTTKSFTNTSKIARFQRSINDDVLHYDLHRLRATRHSDANSGNRQNATGHMQYQRFIAVNDIKFVLHSSIH